MRSPSSSKRERVSFTFGERFLKRRHVVPVHRAASPGKQPRLGDDEGTARNASDHHTLPRQFAQPGKGLLIAIGRRIAARAHQQKIELADVGTEGEIGQHGGAARGDRRLIIRG